MSKSAEFMYIRVIRIICLGVFVGFFTSLLAAPFFAAHAQITPTATKKDPKKQTLSFEDELVEGGTQRPDLFYLFQKKNFNYNRLIRLRENFLPEMRKTAEDVQRSRGKN